MPLPVFIVNGHDHTRLLAEDGLKPSRNDLDKDGSGRNLLNGLMYRTRIGTKLKYSVAFNRLTAEQLQRIEADMANVYCNVTLLVAKTNRHETHTFYSSTTNEGVQRALDGQTYYDGVAFDITER